MAIVDDEEIARLILMPKRVGNPRARTLTQRGSERLNFEVEGPSGERFQVYVRQNARIPEGFSCGILYFHPSGEKVTLARYNGSDHEHTNPLDEGKPLPMACHIHKATERYIDAGRKAEHYAETTDRYTDLKGAVRALIEDCNIHGLGDNNVSPQIKLL
jgi:hypothetical protein